MRMVETARFGRHRKNLIGLTYLSVYRQTGTSLLLWAREMPVRAGEQRGSGGRRWGGKEKTQARRKPPEPDEVRFRRKHDACLAVAANAANHQLDAAVGRVAGNALAARATVALHHRLAAAAPAGLHQVALDTQFEQHTAHTLGTL